MKHPRSRTRILLTYVAPILFTVGLAGAGAAAYAMDGRNPDARPAARDSRTVTVKVRTEKWADQKCAGQTLTLDLTTYMAGA
jgi:hypothetical protein